MPRNDEVIYTAWRAMRYRCDQPTNKDYPSYGGRGIKVCPEWYDFAEFMEWAVAAGWQPGLTLDRINVDGNYEPGNCRWVTRIVQSNNRRVTRRYEHGGLWFTARELYGFYNVKVSYNTFNRRLRTGWTVSDAIRYGKNERYAS